MFETYKPSGRVGVLTVPVIPVSMVVTIILAYLYQLLIYWIPFIYVNFILTAVFGIGIGMMANVNIKLGHVRNVFFGVLIGLALFVVGLGAKYYFQYQTFIGLTTDYVMEDQGIPENQRAELEQDLRKEFTFLKHLEIRADEGWSIGRAGGGLPITGIFVYLIWGIEALIVVWFAVTMPRDSAGEPYSEQKNEWAGEEDVVMTLPVTDAKMVEQIRNARSVEELLNIPIPKTDQSREFAVYKVNSIEGDELEDAYLTVTLETHVVKDDGDIEKKEEPLVKYAVLSSENRKQLVENAELLSEAIEEYRAAMAAEETGHVVGADDDAVDVDEIADDDGFQN